MRPPPHSRGVIPNQGTVIPGKGIVVPSKKIVIPSGARPSPGLRDEEARSRGTRGLAFLPPLLALSLLLSSAPAAPKQRQQTKAAAWPFATIRHACGPTDGPALQITLTKVANPGKKDARLFLSLYRDLPEMPLAQPRTFELTRMLDGDGARCLKPNACESAERGHVVLEKLDGTAAEGSYELHFKDGSSERGRFKAAWKEIREACG